jgi:2-hydroxycyclohexanecarboxyl-CoA dehydrogenase
MSELPRNWKQSTDLLGKVVVLTGGASGIGRATALQYVMAGSSVYVGDIDKQGGARLQTEAAQLGGSLRFIEVDLFEKQSIDRFTEEIAQSTQR